MKAIILHDFTAHPDDLAITMTHLMNLRISVKLVDVTEAVSVDFQGVDWVILHCWMPDQQLPISVQNVLTRIPCGQLQQMQIIELPDIERAAWFHREGSRLCVG